MSKEISYLGKIIRVDSEVVEIEISDDIPSAAPIINGRLYKLGQIGTFVKFPIGNIKIYGIVSAVSNMPYVAEASTIKELMGSRYLTVQLIGEKVGDSNFERGIGTYPTINDEAHIVIEKDLFDIYGEKSDGAFEIGTHSSSENLKINLDAQKFVLRHSAIFGSTGSGKSNATVGIIKSLLNDFSGSRVVLVDPHGEYASAFPNAKVFKIGDKSNPLFIPYWLMNFNELAFFLVGARSTEDTQPQHRDFRELITKHKKDNRDLKAGKIKEALITADSPIPFNIRKIWHEMNWLINATFDTSKKSDQSRDNAFIVKEGNADELIPTLFKPFVMGPNPPFKSQQQEYFSYEKKLRTRLKDSRYDFMFNPGKYDGQKENLDLHDLLESWIGNSERLTILDLSGAPFEILDISIGLITRFIYDSMYWGRNQKFTGKNRPLLIAYEEAHSYLNIDEINKYSIKAVEKIFKEGRKFGVGALVVSQRPSEISETILAQIGNYISLRLTNSSDQSIIKSSSPDNMNSLIDLLPALRTGEAIVVGESIKIPSRVRMPLNEPRPTSEDPLLVQQWKKEFPVKADAYKQVVTIMREQILRKPTEKQEEKRGKN